jgi:transcriptional regulator with XRE-family HTH domain
MTINWVALSRRVQEKRGFTVGSLAERLSMARPLLVRVEAGEAELPELYQARLLRFAGLCGIRVDEKGEIVDARGHRLTGARGSGDVRISASMVRDWRQQLGWTQHQLADAIGVRKAAVGFWEQGRRPIPRDCVDAIRGLMRQTEIAPPVGDVVPPALEDAS